MGRQFTYRALPNVSATDVFTGFDKYGATRNFTAEAIRTWAGNLLDSKHIDDYTFAEWLDEQRALDSLSAANSKDYFILYSDGDVVEQLWMYSGIGDDIYSAETWVSNYTDWETRIAALEQGGAGNGDMTKAVYDTNNNGLVDNSDYDSELDNNSDADNVQDALLDHSEAIDQVELLAESKQDKVPTAIEGNLQAFDSEGNSVDSGKKASDFSLWGGASIIHVTSDVNPTIPYTYYKASGASIIYLPDPVLNCVDEFDVELESGSDKIIITTVSSVAGAIQGSDALVIPNVGGRLRLKCHSTEGYDVILDTRGMRRIEAITVDRDFSDGDGFEHNTLYTVTPNPSGSAILITLPPPTSFDNGRINESTFILNGLGSFTVIRSDGGNVGNSSQQTVSNVGAAISISEANNIYGITQDSRPKASTSVLELPSYRLDEDSDIVGYKALTSDKDDPRYGAEVLLSTPALTDGTIGSPVNYSTYVTDDGFELGSFPTASANFIVTARISNQSGSANLKRGAIAYYELYKRTAAGVETLIVTSSTFYVISESFSQLIINAETPETTFEPTDRLVWKVWVSKENQTGGINPIIESKIEGVDGARLVFLLPSSLAKHSNLLGLSDPSQHPSTSIDHVEHDGTTQDSGQAINDRMRPRGEWSDGDTYYPNDYVTEEGYAGVALVETSDRLAPQEFGEQEQNIPFDAAWEQGTHVGVVAMEQTFTYKQGGFEKALYAGASVFSFADTISRLTVENITRGTFKTYDRPILAQGVDTLLSAGSYPVKVGDVIKVTLFLLNAAEGQRIVGGWAASLNAAPTSGQWGTDSLSNPTYLAFNDVDLDGLSMQTELEGLTVDSIIWIAEKGDNSRYIEAKVDSIVDNAGYVTYNVTPIHLGAVIRTGKACSVRMDEPSATPTTYDYLPNAYDTQPDYADVVSALYFDGVLQAQANTTGYRVIEVHQNASVSDDYEYYSWPTGGGGGVKRVPYDMAVAISDETSDITVDNDGSFAPVTRKQEAQSITFNTNVAPSGSSLIVNIEKNASVICTLTLPSGSTSVTSTAITDTVINIGDVLTYDVTQVGATIPGAGGKITINSITNV